MGPPLIIISWFGDNGISIVEYTLSNFFSKFLYNINGATMNTHKNIVKHITFSSFDVGIKESIPHWIINNLTHITTLILRRSNQISENCQGQSSNYYECLLVYLAVVIRPGTTKCSSQTFGQIFVLLCISFSFDIKQDKFLAKSFQVFSVFLRMVSFWWWVKSCSQDYQNREMTIVSSAAGSIAAIYFYACIR